MVNVASGLRGSCHVTMLLGLLQAVGEAVRTEVLDVSVPQKKSHGVISLFTAGDYFGITLIVSVSRFSVNTYGFVFPQQQ